MKGLSATAEAYTCLESVVTARMPEFHRATADRINVFQVEDTYYFKQYFDESTFSELRQYYDEYEYRFEIPESRFNSVRDILHENGFAPVVVDSIDPFTVVKRKYTHHPKSLFRGAVLHRSIENFNCFIMKDREAVEKAVQDGGTPLTDTEIALTLG